jgi:hypothetical protein
VNSFVLGQVRTEVAGSTAVEQLPVGSMASAIVRPASPLDFLLWDFLQWAQ